MRLQKKIKTKKFFRNEVIRHLLSFNQIVHTICDLNRACVEYNYNSLSPWWQNIRETLLENACVFKSLLAALLCKGLSPIFLVAQKDVMENGFCLNACHTVIDYKSIFSFPGSRQH